MASPSAASAAKPIRLGVVGLGRFGRVHALTAVGVSEAELVALVDARQEAIDRLPAGLTHVPCWTDLDRALNESDAEAWIVTTSTDSHVPLARALLSAGRSVLVEKPIADSLPSAESLAPFVRADSSNLMVGHVALFGSEFRQLMREVRLRGPITFIDAVRHRPSTTLDHFPGESPFALTMVHDLYQILVLMGGAEPMHISAQAHRTDDGQCDLAMAQFRWADGAIASLSASFMTPPGLPHDGFDRLEVFGRGWAARLLPNPRPITVWDDRARWPLPLEIDVDPEWPTGMLTEQLRCFCRVVHGMRDVPFGATYADAMQVLRWIDRLRSLAE